MPRSCVARSAAGRAAVLQPLPLPADLALAITDRPRRSTTTSTSGPCDALYVTPAVAAGLELDVQVLRCCARFKATGAYDREIRHPAGIPAEPLAVA